MPEDSATVRSVGGEQAAWTTSQQLLAGVVDVLNIISWQLSGAKGARPKPIERPGSNKGRTKLTVPEIQRRLQAQLRRRRR